MANQIDLRTTCYSICVLLTVAFGFFLSPFLSSILGLVIIWILTVFLLQHKISEFLLFPSNSRMGLSTILSYLSGLMLFFCLQNIIGWQNSSFKANWSATANFVFLVVPFQSLYEEVVFRGIVLNHFFIRKNRSQLLGMILVALLFSLSHLLNYFYTEDILLNFSTLTTLFGFGLMGNILFVRQRHLGGVWGFHAGWNSMRFSLVYSLNNREVTEGESFNLLEGSWPGLLLAVVALGFVSLFFERNRK